VSGREASFAPTLLPRPCMCAPRSTRAQRAQPSAQRRANTIRQKVRTISRKSHSCGRVPRPNAIRQKVRTVSRKSHSCGRVPRPNAIRQKVRTVSRKTHSGRAPNPNAIRQKVRTVSRKSHNCGRAPNPNQRDISFTSKCRSRAPRGSRDPASASKAFPPVRPAQRPSSPLAVPAGNFALAGRPATQPCDKGAPWWAGVAV
jgi:hypothetical protein